ncbi:MFS transporter [Nocardia blacklockiae]|uniref:MFS transporter n=1 Tax=Nocardia blacklockiae TaxID=480036 RepID=UPI001892D96F|nr:MFS transporter [Nocardia blacklockiae]MBF6173497.1 MFS transporter [Nocardia blacklockiae]
MTTTIPATARPGAAMTALALGVLSYGLMQTMLVPAIGVLQHALHTSATAATWAVMSAPLLASAILTPLVSRLGDRYGRRRTLLVALGVYLAATLAALLAPHIGVLIAARAGQGISLAVLPLAFGSVPDILPPERVHAGLGLLSGLVGGAAGIALVCGGLIVDHASWRWLFVVGAGLITAALVLTYRFVPDGPAAGAGRLDPAGTVLLAAGLCGVLLALSIGPSDGWLGAPTLALAVGGVLLLVMFVRVERRLRQPLLEMDLVLRRTVGGTHLAALTLGAMQFMYYVLVPKLVEAPTAAGGFGCSVTAAGLVMLPSTLVVLPAGAVAGRVIARRGPQLPLAAGLLLTAAGAALLAVAHGSLWQAAVCALPIGLGTGLVMTALPSRLHHVVDPARAATANGINTVSRTVGGALGSQLGAALIAGSVTGGFPTAFWIATAIGIVGAAVVFGV